MNSLVYSEDDFKATYATNRPDPSSLKENPVSPMVLDIKDTTTVNEIVNDKETTPDNKNQDNTDITDMIKSILYDILDQATKPKVITIISHLIIKPSDIKQFPTVGHIIATWQQLKMVYAGSASSNSNQSLLTAFRNKLFMYIVCMYFVILIMTDISRGKIAPFFLNILIYNFE
ncbi:hypothetical protein NQ314_017970 [Rhamnusium bicolor]|uniref:Uncharacterized protein n=1 Tax=Rhamnusium bicolor TaxID=1586634 RepID=A0AAV8WUD9_9CUCU|nr:hypothetical protein NQ314_017970 [Rhamnusium bicolor]